jgi:hypothetical protein
MLPNEQVEHLADVDGRVAVRDSVVAAPIAPAAPKNATSSPTATSRRSVRGDRATIAASWGRVMNGRVSAACRKAAIGAGIVIDVAALHPSRALATVGSCVKLTVGSRSGHDREIRGTPRLRVQEWRS